MKKLFRLIAFVFLTLVLQSILVNLYHNLKSQKNECREYSVMDSLSVDPQMIHSRFWRDNANSGRYCMDYSYSKSSFNESSDYRNSMKISGFDSYHAYWGEIYKLLYSNDLSSLSTIRDSLMDIRNSKQLNRTEFAHMVVKFVQDIPYSYVISDDCDKYNYSKPCQGGAKFGILSPVEFLYSLYGDCDTRTVLLYGLLKDMGYDPLIMISNEYLHSMLALNIPSAGEYISHNGKKFYFWETTNTGWEPGMLAPDMKNVKYWDIALD